MSALSPIYADADFVRAYQDLLPTGPIWPREPDATITQTILPLVKAYTRNAASAVGLLADALPVQPVQLLPEWQYTLGLPDPCAGPAPTLAVAQAQVNARFIASGGQSAAYYISVAAALGYAITITTYLPFQAGISTAGTPDYSAAWAYAWTVHAPTYTIQYFRAGDATAGTPLATFGNTVLQCELQRLAPAHTVLNFSYP